MDREERDELLEKVDEVADGSPKGRLLKEVIEALPIREDEPSEEPRQG